ncbi:endonuclease III [Prochlorococcus sp. MIT 1223]|uniref:endonuclease III n=1 Tax=Prochlorococcus sp. MIT 1223 TaxID=3096217 RepID=UPI002A75A519|nr:endonuclease III [Prochlorococcus sp. MIT 1223]
MNRKERSEVIMKRLEELYPTVPIPLDHKNSFTLLIAVVLSAQSTDKKVNELTKPLFRIASDPEAMIEIGEKKIYEFIRQLGLSKTKAKNVFNLSNKLKEDFNSKVPNNFKDLESLPGVGHKTASVVLAQSFGIPTFPIDTHIHRLAQRWGMSNGINVKQTEKDLKRIFPKDKWNKLHLQIIFYGREYCTAKGCDGTLCNLCVELYPNRSKPFLHKKA